MLKNDLTIFALSDTHAKHRDVNLGSIDLADVVVFAGDLMTGGWKQTEVQDFGEWFSQLPVKHKIVVAGNHDRLFETNPKWCMSMFDSDVHYLNDSGVEIEGVKFWGSPVQPWFHAWAFNKPRGAAIREHWDKIPPDTDVLITHGPPFGIRDQIVPGNHKPMVSNIVILPTEHLGCEELRIAVERIRPQVNIFGHIHGAYGYDYTSVPGVAFHNVAICDESYKAVNRPSLLTVRKRINEPNDEGNI